MRSALSRERSSSSRRGNVRNTSLEGKGECRNRPSRTCATTCRWFGLSEQSTVGCQGAFLLRTSHNQRACSAAGCQQQAARPRRLAKETSGHTLVGCFYQGTQFTQTTWLGNCSMLLES